MTEQPPGPDGLIPPAEPTPVAQAPYSPPHPQYLGYRSVGDERRHWPEWAQAFIGFFLAAGTSAAASVFGLLVAISSKLSGAAVVALMVAVGVAPLLLFVPIGVSMRRRGGWRAFLPGALAGWGVVALAQGLCFASFQR